MVSTKKHEYDQKLDDGEFIALPQKTRVDIFAHFFIRLKQKSIICNHCHGLSAVQLRKQVMSDEDFQQSLKTEYQIPTAWFKRYNQTVKSIIINHHKIHHLKNKNAKLDKNQKSEHDEIQSFQRIRVNWDCYGQLEAYRKKVKESLEKYCKENESPNQRGKSPKHRTNKKINRVSYWKLSQQDCYDLCSTTRDQIGKMADECKISEEIVFLFFHRFYTGCSFKLMSMIFGFSESSLKSWWKEAADKLEKWAEKRMINDGPEEKQYWTTQKIHDRTTEFAKRIHDPENEGRTMVIMDGTYIFTQEVQADHEIRKKSYSKHKSGTLYKPHLVVTTMGDIIHAGDVFYSDGHHSDQRIYQSMFTESYLDKCEAEPESPESVLTQSQIKRNRYFLKIWAKQKGIAITDNGYTIPNDPKIRRPKDLPKNAKRVPTVFNGWKRGVTINRQVTERVNNNIKRWELIGNGNLNTYEISNLEKYVKIACGHHNEFSSDFQKDHVDNRILTDRLLELRTVVKNPCDEFWIPKPKPRKRADKNVPLPPKTTPPHDDGFEKPITGMESVINWIKNCDWLKELDLNFDDGKDFVGRQFQHRLVDSYIRKLEKNFQIKAHKLNEFVVKFENLKSKYTSSKTRHVILNFQPIIEHRILRSSNHNHNNRFESAAFGLPSLEEHDVDMENKENKEEEKVEVEETQMTESENTDSGKVKALKEKSWKDVDFSLWKTDLGRLQYFCTCNAGAQLANPCAHVSSCIYFMIWINQDCLADKLKTKKRDQRIKENVTDLSGACAYFNRVAAENKDVKLYCVCRQPFHGSMIQCYGCEEWYHPKCISSSESEIRQMDAESFKCWWCDPYVMFLNQCNKKGDGLCPNLENMSVDGESDADNENSEHEQ